MPRDDAVEPTQDEHGNEVHPAFGMIHASRVTQGGAHGGAVLFDSEIKHNHYVVLRIQRASRKRDLHHDWLYGREELIEVAMSEAQWASFVSSMNTSGVPCTLRHTQDEVFVAELPYAPRMAYAMAETSQAAERAFEKAREALATYEAHKTAGNLRALHTALENARPNIDYATKTLSEHVEGVVTRARADVEAMVAHHATTLGLDSANLTLALPVGESDES